MTKNKIIIPVAIFIVAIFSYSIGFGYGSSQPKNIVIEGLKGGENPENIDADFKIFWEAWSELKSHHIDGGELNAKDFVYGAIEGLANSFNDPYTIFLDPEDSKKFNEDVGGSFGGIGAEIGIRNEQLTVIAPLKNTPAEKAGLRAKDKIIKINDEITSGVTIDDAVKSIRGVPGTKVTLTIFRDEWERSKDIEIIRQVIEVPTVDWKFVDDKLIHMQLSSFNWNLIGAFSKALTESLGEGGRGLIIDLRNNPGGFLETAVDLAGWFLDKGSVVVTEKFTSGKENIFRANGNASLKHFPIVILINGGSASASEIFAGALKHHLETKIIGEKSFGKGTVQQLDQLSDGSSLKITIANWLMPNGEIIEKNGIEPDYPIEITDENIKNEEDPQLEKAIEILNQEIKF
ncbi:MAG TPA: S41 family peptidase [Candidatus Paceibacterota bacterium]